jgi:hypothetical protein
VVIHKAVMQAVGELFGNGQFASSRRPIEKYKVHESYGTIRGRTVYSHRETAPGGAVSG